MSVLSELPPPNPARIAVRVAPRVLRHIRRGHPWVFDGGVTSVSAEGAPGDFAVIFDDDRKFAAIGLYDPNSPIRVRMLHAGKPRQIDDAFWAERIDAALALRRPLLDGSTTTGMRLIHGENDRLPGFTVDRYDTTLVVKLYSEAWLPHLNDVLLVLLDRCGHAGIKVDRVVLRASRQVRSVAPEIEGATVIGDEPDGPIEFLENGLRFLADVVHGQKTGHFLDQRDNRLMVRSMANGRRVLDVFACTGGFSVNAAAGGATEVTSVDLSSASLFVAKQNMALNLDHPGVAACDHQTLVADAFDAMVRLARDRRRFDLVIIDPPSFAHREADRRRALGAYRRLADLGMALVAPKGLYVQSSCSSRISTDELRETVLDAADATGRSVDIRAESTHALDHPIGFDEGAYLKTIALKFEPRGTRPERHR
ncbi:MAG: class I SAM-dependent rRNA methyltransferase [Actinobacteria bacterium]|nr:class I SAM-dependent rRNA methyltransferase [Actinomycetota bacterium]